MEDFKVYIESRIAKTIDEVIEIGPTNFRLVSNVPDFPSVRFFSKTARSVYRNQTTDFEIWCISPKEIQIEEEYIRKNRAWNYRGNSFFNGYYATDHFGAPVQMVIKGNSFYVFGEGLENIVWTFFVKYFLFLHTIEKDSLFLKSAAFAVNRKGTLLLGRGGSGKTVFLTLLCRNGAEFITNSHSVIKDGFITGVASSMRVRPDRWLSELIPSVKQSPALRSGEIIIDPYDVFQSDKNIRAELKNLCIINFQQPDLHIIKTLSDEEAYSYIEQFSLAMNVYRLEEDLLDYFQNDIGLFSEIYEKMKAQLREIVGRSRCFYISSNLFVKKNRDEIFELLS